MGTQNGSWRDQIEVRSSAIHGRGLFARKAIGEGALIGRFEGRLVTEDGTHVLWVEEEDGSWRGIEVQNELKYTNHSHDPNAEVYDDQLVA